MKPRKIPMRMCVGCREMKEKRELSAEMRNAFAGRSGKDSWSVSWR